MTHDELIEATKQALADTTDFDGDRMASRYADSELADMARAAIRVIAPAVWQPVETAPEDGDMFVTDGTRVEVAFRDSGMSSYRFFSPTTHSDLHFQPTHWMPVPALPSAP